MNNMRSSAYGNGDMFHSRFMQRVLVTFVFITILLGILGGILVLNDAGKFHSTCPECNQSLIVIGTSMLVGSAMAFAMMCILTFFSLGGMMRRRPRQGAAASDAMMEDD